MVEIAYQNETGFPLDEPRTSRLISDTLRSEDRALQTISLSYVTTDTMRALNLAHRAKASPTDVLSWPFDDGFPQGCGGELIIAPEVAERNAAEHGQTLAVELDVLTVHGVLHLLGYEDATSGGASAMEERTMRVLGGVRG